MTAVNTGLGLLLLAIGAGLCLYLIRVVLNPVLRLASGGKQASRLRKARERLKITNSLIEAQDYANTIRELRRAVLYDTLATREQVAALRDHFQNILSKALVIAEELGSKPENLADVEHLFMERVELLVLHIKATEAYDSVQHRWKKQGKELPEWGRTDYSRRQKDVAKELERNRKALEVTLKKFFAALENPSSGDIVYH